MKQKKNGIGEQQLGEGEKATTQIQKGVIKQLLNHIISSSFTQFFS